MYILDSFPQSQLGLVTRIVTYPSALDDLGLVNTTRDVHTIAVYISQLSPPNLNQGTLYQTEITL